MENYALYPAESSNTFRELLDNCQEYYGGRDMFREKDGAGGIRPASARAFRELAYNLGAGLMARGLLNGKAAVIGETSVKWIAAYFAVTAGGGVVVPIDKELPDGEIANIIRDSGAIAVVYSPAFEGVMQTIAGELPEVRAYIGMERAAEDGKFLRYDTLVSEGAAHGWEAYLEREADGDALGSLLYTSGTTGKSKGVMLTQKNILRCAQGGNQMFYVGQVVMSVLPVHHSYEFSCGIVMQMMMGKTICINDSLRYFMQNLQLFKPESLYLVPAFVEMIYKKIWANAKEAGTEEQLKAAIQKSNELLARGIDKRAEFFKGIRDALGGNLEIIICGGAPLAAFYVKAFREIGISLIQGYGITECAPLVSVNRNEYYKDGSIGLPIGCCEVEIRNEEEGGGEIWVKGGNVMLGYYQNPGATAEVMDGEWFNTGDIGHIDEDGFLFITGRKKNLIVLSNGKNVYPEEVEGYLARIPYIKEVVVYSPVLDGMDQKLAAEIFVDEAYAAAHSPKEVEANMEADIAEINKGLPLFKQVHEFHLRDKEFEKTTKKSIKRFTVAK